MQVPGYRLAFAVGIGSEKQRIGFFQRLPDRGEVLLVLLDDGVLHRVAMLGVDRAFLRHEVANMTIGGEDLVVLAEIFLDGLRLRGRLDDDDARSHFASARNPNRGGAAVRKYQNPYAGKPLASVS